MVHDLPSKNGNIEIYPKIYYGNTVSISIIGDPEGLRYLAELLNQLADFDQEDNSDPIGEREHIHLSPEFQLGTHSCQVELCRADAKGTGDFPDYMEKT